MSVNSFKKELWETALLEGFREVSTADLITAKPTSVDGKVAHFNVASLATGLKDYEGTVAFEDIDTTSIDLYFDKSRYFALKLDDVDRVQLAGDVMTSVTADQAYEIKVDIDKAIYKEAIAGAKPENVIGSDGAKEMITNFAEAYNFIVDLGTKLDENKVPTSNRFIVAPPEFVNLLAKDSRVLDNAIVLPNGIVQGMDVNGIKVIKTADIEKGKVLVLHNSAVAFGKQIDKVEALRLESSFSDGVRGLVQYGVKTLRPNAIGVLHYEI